LESAAISSAIELERRIDLDAPRAREGTVEALSSSSAAAPGCSSALRASSRGAPRITPGEIPGEIGFGSARSETRPAARASRRTAQIAAVGFERVFRKAVLEPDSIAEFIQERAFSAFIAGSEPAPSCASSQRLIARWNPPSWWAKAADSARCEHAVTGTRFGTGLAPQPGHRARRGTQLARELTVASGAAGADRGDSPTHGAETLCPADASVQIEAELRSFR